MRLWLVGLLLWALPLQAAPQRFSDTRPLTVVHVAAEGAPYAKTGGLGDVVQDVPKLQAAQGHQVIRVQPKLRSTKTEHLEGFQPVTSIDVTVDNRQEPVEVLAKQLDGVTHVLLESRLFDTAGPYDGGDAALAERFIALQQAGLKAPRALGAKADVFHAHDWHTAPIAAMLKLQRVDPGARGAKSVVTIHNVAFQGHYDGPLAALKAGFSSKDFTWDKLAHYGGFNFLKAGLQFADGITTVSRNHALELLAKQSGMEGVLNFRKDSFVGIPNGVDTSIWTPSGNALLPLGYDVDGVAAGKAANKAAAQAEFGLDHAPAAPMLAIVSRLTRDKGMDLALQALPGALAAGAQLIMTGVGEPDLVDGFKALAAAHPGRVFFNAAFDVTLPHRMYAAADFLIMPSRIEPGGLSNQQAQQYGALPIVAPVGGLVDSTTHGVDGFVMRDVTAAALTEAIDAALAVFRNPARFAPMPRQAMRRDKSWAGPINAYEGLYYSLVGLPLPG